jgi:uncharacterized damage-inducible protein DinB
MTLNDVKFLFAYSSWSTNLMLESVECLTADQRTRDLKASLGSIWGTVLHIVWAEKIWLTRWGVGSAASIPADLGVKDVAGLRSVWESVGYERAKFLGTLSDRTLNEQFTYTDLRGRSNTITYEQSMAHLVDHGSFHRGQVIAMERQLGVQPPATGMLVFIRESKGAS